MYHNFSKTIIMHLSTVKNEVIQKLSLSLSKSGIHYYKGILSKLSYGTTFWHRVAKVNELFFKIEFPNDFGFFTVERYMPIVLGKIVKHA